MTHGHERPSHFTAFPAGAEMRAAPARGGGSSHLSLVPSPRLADSTEDGALQYIDIGPLDLELGGHLPAVTMAFRTWGELNRAGDNAVIVLHALTGDSKAAGDRKSTRLNSSHLVISYAVFCLKKKNSQYNRRITQQKRII